MSRMASPSPHKSTPETLSIDLDRLLQRLESQLLSPTSDTSALAHSSYERSRVGANVEYARTLLLRLDHASTGIKTTTRKNSAQSDLATKRDLIKRLNQRLLELNQVDDSSSSSSEAEEDDEDEVQQEEGQSGASASSPRQQRREFAPAQHTNAGLDYDPLTVAGLKGIPTPENDLTASQPNLRSRRSPTKPSATTTTEKPQSQANINRAQPDAASTTALFGGARAGVQQSATTTTQVLEDSEREHSLLTSSLVTLAQSLKASSLSFQSSLAAEKDVLKGAERGLEKNELGMEKAGRGMGALRRMTEGQGWWGRIKLYAIIAALWLACFLLVFLGPKLRF